jgi:hypothetical protein
MKYIILLVPFIFACTPEEELSNIKATQNDCRIFQNYFNEVKPAKTTKKIDDKINLCKEAGAWR